MNELQIFTNDMFGQIRITVIDGEPWFVAADIANTLAYSETSVMLRRLDTEDMVKIEPTKIVGTSSMSRNLTVINESGLYDAIFGSKLPSAKQFKKWVTSEVLPQIRKTGGFIPVSTSDDDITIMAKAHQILERTLQRKSQLILELKPKADTYDMIMLDEGTFDMNSVAKMVGMGEYKLFSYLRDKKVLFYNSNKCNVPFERFRYNGYFKVVDAMCPDGNARAVTRVTQKGVDYICKLIREDKKIA